MSTAKLSDQKFDGNLSNDVGDIINTSATFSRVGDPFNFKNQSSISEIGCFKLKLSISKLLPTFVTTIDIDF